MIQRKLRVGDEGPCFSKACGAALEIGDAAYESWMAWALLLLRVLRWLLRRILRVLLGIRRILSGLLAERTLPRWLTYRLPKASSRLHSWLPHTE